MEVYILSDMYYGWYCTNVYMSLSSAEKDFNASRAMSYLLREGFTRESASAIIGNMWAESGLSPGQWQGGTPYSGGYGLVQWTPYTLYSDWAGPDWENNGPLQMARLMYEKANGLEFYPTAPFNMTFTQFSQSTLSTDYLTEVFEKSYLRPANPDATLANRQYHARYVYENISGSVTPPAWLLYWIKKSAKRWWKPV